VTEALPDRAGTDSMLSTRDVGQSVPYPADGQRRQVASNTKAMATLIPARAALIIGLIPPSPRARRDLKNSIPKVSASEGRFPET